MLHNRIKIFSSYNEKGFVKFYGYDTYTKI